MSVVSTAANCSDVGQGEASSGSAITRHVDRPLRILHVVQKPQRRGAEVFAKQLADWQRGAGHEVTAVYLYECKAHPLEIGPCDVQLGGVENGTLERAVLFDPQLLRSLSRTISAFSPDIVQVNGARTIKYGAAAKLAARHPSWKLVYRNIDSPVFWVRGAPRITFYKHAVMPRIDGVVGVSATTLREVQDFYGLTVPSEFIPNAVALLDLNVAEHEQRMARSELSTPSDATVILFAGTLTSQKRPDRFLRVFARAASLAPGVYAWLLGDGAQREQLQALAIELGIEERVRWLGYRDKVAPYIGGADILLVSSDTEGIPAVVIEAGYLRKPVVATDVGALRECVRNGKTGYLVPKGDEDALVAHVLRLARDPEERMRLGNAAREFITSEFSMDVIAPRYCRFYYTLLGGGE